MASEIIDLRRFEPRDLEPLLAAETSAWNANLRWDYTPATRVIATCLQERRLTGYALLCSGRIRGYSFFFYEDTKGLIGDVFTEPDGLRLEQAHLLLEHTLETLLATPGLRRVEAQLPHFTLPELEAQFRAHGFTAYLRRFMAISLGGRAASSLGTPTPWAAQALPKEIRIEPWERKHDQQAARLLYDAYHDHVDAKINDQYKSFGGSVRLIDNIVRHRGCGEHLTQASLVAIHRATQKLAGILALTTVRHRTAHIPQITVAPEFQGSGLGTAMLDLSFQDLVRRGYQEVTLTVTDLNCGAVRLYERLGFKTFHTFGAFVWNRS